MRIVSYTLALLLAYVSLPAQTELVDDGSSSHQWTMLAIQRTWTPQVNDHPNWGFGFSGFSSLDEDRRVYIGLTLLASGVERRDVVSLTVGPGYWIAGDRTLGAFAWLQAGVAMSSRTGATGFNPFADATLEWGFAGTSGVGGTARIVSWLQLQVAVVANAYSTDDGRTPFGIQFGLSGGGP